MKAAEAWLAEAQRSFPLPERGGLETVNLETSVISLRRLLFKRHVWLAIYILFFTSNLFVFHVVFFGERKIDFKM